MEQQLREKLQHALHLHRDERLLTAARVLDGVEAQLKELKASGGADAAVAESVEKELEANRAQIDELRFEQKFIEELVEEVRADGKDWTPVSHGKVKVWYRQEPDTPIHTVKTEVVLEEIKLTELLCVLYETDLWADLFPFLKFSKCLAKPKRCSQVVHVGLRAMWPVWSRDSVVLGFAVNAFEELGGVVCVSKSVDSHPSVAIPAVDGAYVRADVHLSGYLLEIIDERTTRMTTVVNLDPKLARVPAAVINFFTRNICGLAFQLLQGRVAKFKDNAEHRRRILENREFYGWLEPVVEESLARLQARNAEKEREKGKEKEGAEAPAASLAASLAAASL
eukprot:tig00021326_g20310.t1